MRRLKTFLLLVCMLGAVAGCGGGKEVDIPGEEIPHPGTRPSRAK